MASMLLLSLAGITRYAVAQPLLPAWLAHMLHQRVPALPPGMTYDFEVIDPVTRHPLEALPEIGSVELRLAVTNDSALPMKLHFKTAKQNEFVVRRVYTFVNGLFALPLEVWRSSYFHNYAKHRTVVVLMPGQTKVYQALFQINALRSRELPPGAYRVVADFYGWQTSMSMTKPQ
ncbi:MAG: hypothetical protein DLM53_12275 [Candidatus Eremiobacter antarcticus]|nr:hypothetical protein [Candidatus Eremiobacteraeota bacterium]MBC5808887.1 hypothetical protein [Candidatus Eremiobacteraeota bacterium]PZR60428.1 MAG: hypothetical protein DLM53_12275 [Candidatus Eremiobacter sp. RRmetagenome_bin22]